MVAIFAALLMMSLAISAGRAGDIAADAVETPLPNLVRVVAPQASWAAVDPAGTVLAFAHHQRAKQAGEISIFGIDAQGNPITAPPVAPAPVVVPKKPVKKGAPPAAPPAAVPAVVLPPAPLFTLVLPRPEALSAFPSSAISMVFHPKLPLLYVWQDIAAPIKGPKALAAEEFDHLLIYSLTPGQAPKLELATARGTDYWYAHARGMLAIDPTGKRLALPNLRSSTVNKALHSAIGYVELDERGMPHKKGEQLAIVSLDLPAYGDIPPAMGCVFASETVAIFGIEYGPLTWDTESRRGKLNMCFLRDLSMGNQRLVGHPSAPVLYIAGLGGGTVVRMEHADGYLTLLPQRLVIKDAVLASSPVVMTRGNELALGGAGKVYVARLDGDRFTAGPVKCATVNSPSVEALAYSEKHDRLYVAVDKAP